MAALGRAKLHLGGNYEKYLKGRMQLIKYADLAESIHIVDSNWLICFIVSGDRLSILLKRAHWLSAIREQSQVPISSLQIWYIHTMSERSMTFYGGTTKDGTISTRCGQMSAF